MPVSPEEHTKFLQACLKHASQIDWDAVAKDTGITKNAAGKRYKKFMESQKSGGGDVVGAAPATPGPKKRGKKGGEEGPSGKKQKVQAKASVDVEDDDGQDEGDGEDT